MLVIRNLYSFVVRRVRQPSRSVTHAMGSKFAARMHRKMCSFCGRKQPLTPCYVVEMFWKKLPN